MMEQNSDRIYWIIGAVLVGSILIGAAVWLFRPMFKSKIAKVFNSLMGKASTASDNIPGK